MEDQQQQQQPPSNGGGTLIPYPASKRQRRPSVRLGDIGEQPTYEPYVRRSKQWKLRPSDDPAAIKKGIRENKARRGPPRPIRSGWAPPKPDDAPELKSSASEGNDCSETPDTCRPEPDAADAPSETNDDRHCRSLEDGGVRSWLNRLGLGRYAPVFEIHEVDDEVLPLLTLEDLKDMGINAVGSRRKMFYAIQQLRKDLT